MAILFAGCVDFGANVGYHPKHIGEYGLAADPAGAYGESVLADGPGAGGDEGVAAALYANVG